jgi:hypothetical protein
MIGLCTAEEDLRKSPPVTLRYGVELLMSSHNLDDEDQVVSFWCGNPDIDPYENEETTEKGAMTEFN